MSIEILSNVIGLIIGGGITWYCSYRYYKRAGDELRHEAKELKRLADLTLHALENAELVKLKRNDKGVIEGLLISLSGPISAKSSLSGTATVKKNEKT